MIASIRRIGNALLLIGVFSMSVSLLSSISVGCGVESEGCLATVFSATALKTDFTKYQVNPTVAETSLVSREAPVTLDEFNSLVQIVSGYTLLVSVLVLIILECFELHYIREFLSLEKRAR